MSPKILPRVGGVVDPVNIFLPSFLITQQNLVAVSHAMCAHVYCVAGSNNLGTLLGPCPLGWGMAHLLETRFSTTRVTLPNLVIL